MHYPHNIYSFVTTKIALPYNGPIKKPKNNSTGQTHYSTDIKSFYIFNVI